MDCERFVGSGILLNVGGEKTEPKIVHTQYSRSFSNKSSKRLSRCHDEEDIALLDVVKPENNQDEKVGANDILNFDQRSLSNSQVNFEIHRDNEHVIELQNEEIKTVII